MNLFRNSFCICTQNYRKWVTNYRIWILFILVSIFVASYTKEIVKFADLVNYDVAPWMFPFLYGQKYMKFIIFIGILLLFCDAPFIDEVQQYVIVRSGRISWSIGQIWYIITSSAFYFAFILVISIVINIGHIEFNSDWGKVLGTLGGINVGDAVSYKIAVSGRIVTFFTPLQAMWFTFLLSWLAGTFLGLLIYVFNVISSTRFLGITCGAFFIFFEPMLRHYPKLIWFSPISWSTLDSIDITGRSDMPNIVYILVMYTVLILTLSIVAVWCSKKQTIEVRPSI